MAGLCVVSKTPTPCVFLLLINLNHCGSYDLVLKSVALLENLQNNLIIFFRIFSNSNAVVEVRIKGSAHAVNFLQAFLIQNTD